MKRKIPIVSGSFYHIFNKSIAGYKIFNDKSDYSRFLKEMTYYQNERQLKFSVSSEFTNNPKGAKLVKIISYCLMPTHYHMILFQLEENGISNYINRLQNSYSHYFNKRHLRVGPLWVGKYKNVLIENNEQFLHTTRYIHLNPVTANIVDKPQDWRYSSYCEYTDSVKRKICEFSECLAMSSSDYIKFAEDAIDYLKSLASMKKLYLE